MKSNVLIRGQIGRLKDHAAGRQVFTLTAGEVALALTGSATTGIGFGPVAIELAHLPGVTVKSLTGPQGEKLNSADQVTDQTVFEIEIA